MKPKKSLGQNFLTSIPARLAMIEAGEVMSNDTILEIGPGKGFLTEALLAQGASVYALEKDTDLIPLLTEKFAKEVASKQLLLIEGDALTFFPEDRIQKPYKLIANIPYYITGAILSKYLTHKEQPVTIAVLVQKEVAIRACAQDNKHSLLSLSIHAYGIPKVFYKVSRGSFFPVPSVDSAILQITNISRKNFLHTCHEELFFKLIHAGFAHKRKYAVSNIQEIFTTHNIRDMFAELSLDPKIRAEDIPLATWLTIAEKLSRVS